MMQQIAAREPSQILIRTPVKSRSGSSMDMPHSGMLGAIMAQRGNLKAAASKVSARTAGLPKNENVITSMLVGIRGFKKDTLSKCARQAKGRVALSSSERHGNDSLFHDFQAGSTMSLSRALAERFRLCQMGTEDEDEHGGQAWQASP